MIGYSRKFTKLAPKLLAVILLLMTVSLGLSHKASAFGVTPANSVGPTTGSALYNGSTTVSPFYVVGNNPGVYNYPDVYVSAYFTATSGTATIIIDNGNPECHGYNSNGIVGPDYTTGALPPAVVVQIPGYPTKSFLSGCANDSAKNFTVDIGALPNENDFPSQVYNKVASIHISSMALGQGENSFRVIVNVNSGSAAVGISAQVPNATGLGFRASPPAGPGCTGCTGNIDNGNHWTGEVMFAPSIQCSDFASTGVAKKTGTINYYDADPPGIGGPGDQWNPNIQFRLQHQALDANGNPTGNWGDIIQPLDTAYLTANPSGTFRGSLTFVSGWRYRVLFEQVGVRNTIKFSFSGGISQVSTIDPLTINKCYSAKCSISYAPVPPAVNPLKAGDTVKVTINMNNNGINTWVNGQQFMRRTGPSPVPDFGLGGNIAPGSTKSFTDQFVINKSNIYTYRMFINSSLMMKQTPVPCSQFILIGPTTGCSGPSCSPELDVLGCSSAIIRNVNSNSIKATWHSAPAGSPYLTYQPPPWPTPPPVATPPYTGTTYSYPGTPSPSVPITQVPVQILVKDPDGNTLYTYQIPPGGSPGSGGVTKGSDFTVDMADLWNKANMFPHNDYQLALVVKGVNAQDSLTYKNDGNWTPDYTPITFNTAPISGCWEASCSGDYTSAVDVEPGQTADVRVGFTITNRSPRSFNNVSQYNALPTANPGLTLLSGPVPVNIPANADPAVTVYATFQVRVDFQGDYTATLRFGNTPLTEVCNGPNIYPLTKPFFQVWGGDIFTGGSFLTPNQACPTTYPDYVSPQTAPGNKPSYGGIKAYGDTSTGHGSAADFGAVALGLIANKPSPANIGFTARSILANSGSFPPDSISGYLNDSSPAHCVTDFYDTTQTSPVSVGPPSSLANLVVTPSSSGQYIVGSQVNGFAGGQIASSQHITLYVNGDVTITGNITYQPWANRDDSSTAPFFSLIVKGSITLTKDVTRLDGLYVAQPTSSGSGSGGDFVTCDNFCNQQLIVNGAVVAQHIQLLRSFGTLTAGPTVASSPAEIFNYIPSMLISNPNFNPTYNNLQGLFNLPPVF